MCLLVLAVGRHPRHPVILAGNRDEFHARATEQAQWWEDKRDILGGRDLVAGGTWLALHRNGRFATVTNFRDAEPRSLDYRSRGHLVTEFLDSPLPPLEYMRTIDGSAYTGFNLLVGDTDSAAYLSNRGAPAAMLAPGIYGLSNALLDTPWEKVVRSKAAFSQLLEGDSVSHAGLLDLLNDRRESSDEVPEPAPLDAATARALTAPFIVMPHYGTRCSTAITSNQNGNWQLSERRYDERGDPTGESHFSFATER